jgi:hypothetical protein
VQAAMQAQAAVWRDRALRATDESERLSCLDLAVRYERLATFYAELSAPERLAQPPSRINRTDADDAIMELDHARTTATPTDLVARAALRTSVKAGERTLADRRLGGN